MKMVEFLKAVFNPTLHHRVSQPADLQEFNNIRKKTHQSIKRLTKAVKDDPFSAMTSRMKSNGSKKHK